MLGSSTEIATEFETYRRIGIGSEIAAVRGDHIECTTAVRGTVRRSVSAGQRRRIQLIHVPVEPVFSPDVRGGHHGNNKSRHGHSDRGDAK